MATIYLSSVDGNDSDDGSTWALAKSTLAAALTAAGAGGTVYVDNAHAETQASTMTLASPGTAASPVHVICVDRTGDPEPPTTLATTATVTTTGNVSMLFQGVTISVGVKYSIGSGGAGASAAINFTSSGSVWRMIDGLITYGTTSGSQVLTIGGAGAPARLYLENTPLAFGSTGQLISGTDGELIWTNTPSAIAGSVPTVLVSPTRTLNVTLRGVDLSAATSGKSLFNVASAFPSVFSINNCKLGSSVSITTGSITGQSGPKIVAVNCDSADTNYRFYSQTYQGIVTHETTIVRTNGAGDGTTAISRKMVSSANSKFYSPLVLDSLRVWNETTGSAITISVEVVTDGVTLTDAEAWIELEYLGTSGFPLSLFSSDRASDILATPANQASSSETWTTTGLTSPVKQVLSKQITPQEKGVIIARVMLAKASTTMYVCPLLTVT